MSERLTPITEQPMQPHADTIRGIVEYIKVMDEEAKSAEQAGSEQLAKTREQQTSERFRLGIELLQMRQNETPLGFKIGVKHVPSIDGDPQGNTIKVTIRDDKKQKSFIRLPAPETYSDERKEILSDAIGNYDVEEIQFDSLREISQRVHRGQNNTIHKVKHRYNR